ncbi:MAG: fibronectin type III domain-containing protein [Parcubacteria group bacterium]
MKKIPLRNKINLALLALFGAGMFCFSVGAAQAGTAVLNWNANGESDLAGYKIYYDTSSHSGTCPTGYTTSVDAGKVTTYSFDSLPGGHVYYFQLTALDASGNESPCSTNPGEVSKAITYTGDIAPPSRSVNIFDYNLLLSNFGNTVCNNVANIAGNKTGTCAVDIFDYNALLPDFGKSF